MIFLYCKIQKYKIYLVKRITLRARLCSTLFASAITVKYEQFYTIQNFKKIFNFDDLLTPRDSYRSCRAKNGPLVKNVPTTKFCY